MQRIYNQEKNGSTVHDSVGGCGVRGDIASQQTKYEEERNKKEI